jgi:hypothetical protein
MALKILYHPAYLPIFWHSFIENEFKYNERTAIDNFRKSAFFVAFGIFVFKFIFPMGKFFLRRNYRFWVLVKDAPSHSHPYMDKTHGFRTKSGTEVPLPYI